MNERHCNVANPCEDPNCPYCKPSRSLTKGERKAQKETARKLQEQRDELAQAAKEREFHKVPHTLLMTGGGGSRPRARQKKKGTKVCATCKLENCICKTHAPKRNRPRKSVTVSPKYANRPRGGDDIDLGGGYHDEGIERKDHRKILEDLRVAKREGTREAIETLFRDIREVYFRALTFKQR